MTKNPYKELENTGYFYGRPFYVDKRVLIPRPETEQLVEQVKEMATRHSGQPTLSPRATSRGLAEKSSISRKDPSATLGMTRPIRNDKIKILDLGTGSGAIAVTLALELPGAAITASDISSDALAVAELNRQKLAPDAKIDFVQSDLLDAFQKNKVKILKQVQDDKVKDPSATLGMTPQNYIFDIIVANLPYVDKNWSWLDRAALAHEPAVALFAGDDGLKLIKKLIRQAPRCLTPGGFLILEMDPCQIATIKQFAAQTNFTIVDQKPYALTLQNSTGSSRPRDR